MGGNGNGYGIFYLTKGEPDRWPVVVQAHEDPEFYRYNMPLTTFLAELFGGARLMPPWPDGWFRKTKRVVFEPKADEPPEDAGHETTYQP